MSSTKAKIMAGSLAALEAVYLRNLLLDLGQRIGLPTDLYVDNKGAIDLCCKDCVSNDRTKHIERRHLKLVQEATTSVKYMASQY